MASKSFKTIVLREDGQIQMSYNGTGWTIPEAAAIELSHKVLACTNASKTATAPAGKGGAKAKKKGIKGKGC